MSLHGKPEFWTADCPPEMLIYVGKSGHTVYPSGVKVKGKAIPLQTLTCPEGSRSLRFPDFKTIGT
jgi:hypothetical protein